MFADTSEVEIEEHAWDHVIQIPFRPREAADNARELALTVTSLNSAESARAIPIWNNPIFHLEPRDMSAVWIDLRLVQLRDIFKPDGQVFTRDDVELYIQQHLRQSDSYSIWKGRLIPTARLADQWPPSAP